MRRLLPLLLLASCAGPQRYTVTADTVACQTSIQADITREAEALGGESGRHYRDAGLRTGVCVPVSAGTEVMEADRQGANVLVTVPGYTQPLWIQAERLR